MEWERGEKALNEYNDLILNQELPMTRTILVLGARGGVGRAVAEAFHRAGWTVSGLVRPGRVAELPAYVRPVVADLFDAAAVAAAAGPTDAIFDGLNVPYPDWTKKALPTFRAAVDVAAALEALHLFPGNVYNYGAGMPERLTPEVPFRPTSVKGTIRVDVEEMLAEAARTRGVRTIVLRAGDFFGPTGGGSWLGAIIGPKARQGTMRSPGRRDVVHAWAYLPDLARAFVRLAEVADKLGPYELFHFPGHSASVDDLAQAASTAFGRKVKVARVPDFVFAVLGWFSPVIGEARELFYLWRVPHRLVDPRLERVAGPLPATPLSEALAASLP